MPNVSIIFPMYNVAKYVENSLKSVLNQTYRDYEIVAVNDGSTDSTVTIFNRVVNNYNEGIEVTLINKSNGGLADARNVALKAAKGKWVVFIDSDDVVHPKYLEVLVSDSERFNTDLSIASYKKVKSKNLFNFNQTLNGATISKKELMQLMLARKKFDAYCGCFFIKKRMLFDKGILFNKDVKFSVDQAFMWNVVDVANVISINYSQIYNYYLREGSIMTSSKIEQICSSLSHYTSTINSLKNLPFDSEVVINRWKLGILHSTAKITSYKQFLLVEEKFCLNYLKCLEIPVMKAKLFSAIGLISKKLLYAIFRRY